MGRLTKPAPAISIIVPTCDRISSLIRTLDTLYGQSFPAHAYEILIVENGPKSEAKAPIAQVAARHSNHTTRYLHEPVPGLLAGRHRGALEAKGEVLVFVDDDIDASPEWLQAIADSFADDGVALVGGPSLPRYEAPEPAWLANYWWTSPYGGRACGLLSLLNLGNRELVIDPIFIWGLNFSIRREVLFDLGGFHPDNLPDHLQHFQGDGETGLSLKAMTEGARAIYQPRAIVSHRIPAGRLTVRYFERRQFYQGVADSYTSIRKNGAIQKTSCSAVNRGVLSSLAESLRQLWRCQLWRTAASVTDRSMPARATADGIAGLDKTDAARVLVTVQTAYEKGFQFHQCAVESSPELLEWVLKKNYWDYRFPSVDLKKLERLRREVQFL